jgi:hypothetical protein
MGAIEWPGKARSVKTKPDPLEITRFTVEILDLFRATSTCYLPHDELDDSSDPDVPLGEGEDESLTLQAG